MPDNNDPYDFDALTTPAQPDTGGNGARPYYYRPSAGLNDWAARINNYSQANNANPADNPGGTINGEDLQLTGASSQGTPAPPGSLPDTQSMRDSYNAQKQAAAQFGQNQPLTLGTAPACGDPTDFMAAQPLQLQQGVSSNGNGDYNGQPGTSPFAPRPFTLASTWSTGNPQNSRLNTSWQQQQPPAPTADIGDIGTPNIPNGTQGQWFGGSAATDWDGSFDAYGVRGTATAYTGKDRLDNASYGINYIEPAQGPNFEKNRDKSLKPEIIPRDSNGNALINKAGYYQSATSVHDSQNTENYNYVDGEKVPYVALSQQQMQKSGAKYGDYVWVHNTETGQGTWAVVGDYRGSVNPATDGKQDLELSPAAQDRVGIQRVASGKNRGDTVGNPYVSVTVFPNTASGRFH